VSGEQPVVDDAGRELDRIRLTGITATGRHGLLADERRDGQQFLADVVVHLDTRRAAARDDLTYSVDYGRLAQEVHAVLAGEPADLIETVAERIAATVLAHPGVLAVDVAVHKPQAPITVPFGDVVVEIHRDRRKLPAAEPYRAQQGTAEPPTSSAATRAAAHAHPRTAPLPLAETPAAVPLPAPSSARAPHAPSAPLEIPTFADVVGSEAAALAAAMLPGTTAPGAAVPGAAMPAVAVPGMGAAEGAAAPAEPWDAVAVPSWEPVMAVPDDVSATTVLPRTPADAPEPAAPEPPAAPVPVPMPMPAAPAAGDALDQRPATAVDVVLALGSNLGPSQETLREVVAELGQLPGLEVVRVSPLARTAPVGGPEQPDYLDAVVLARTTLAPRELLHALQLLEDRHGRVRLERWGPRTLDLDIVVYGSVLAVTDDLELPHPRAHQRAFVLQPWAQVDPTAVLPGLGGGPVAQLADTAPDRDGVRWMALDWLTAPVQHTGSLDVSGHGAAAQGPSAHAPGATPAPAAAPREDEADDDAGPAWPWGP
jgi:dihydroneopterin aldolase/2-amino-4-hydroxy-6-hydroxymethyldihydropteridine diphosphokinase